MILLRLLGYFPPLLLACLLTVAGCSARTYPVAGVVLQKGAPLPGGMVQFHPDRAQGNNLQDFPIAQIGRDGKYLLAIPAGWYKVTVTTAFGEPNLPAARLPLRHR